MKAFCLCNLKNFVIIVLLFLSITNALISRQSSIKFSNQINFKTKLSAVSEITSAESLDKVIKAAENALVIVDYSTTWCGPCKVAAPKFFDLSEKYPNVIFLKCVGDKTPEAGQLMKREGVRSVPAFHFWKDGNKFDVINGARIDDVENLIKDHISKK
mmetsp:Transcript_2471/g.2204  ORF Transcript_2471/g.2204 Transcript_2471/m.2204 type:complete len:158 (-) Transcript_2471:2-475(-)